MSGFDLTSFVEGAGLALLVVLATRLAWAATRAPDTAAVDVDHDWLPDHPEHAPNLTPEQRVRQGERP